MKARSILLVALVAPSACSGTPAEIVPPPAPPGPQRTAAPDEPVPWTSAWRVGADTWWLPVAPARVLTAQGLVAWDGETTPCGDGVVVRSAEPVILGLGAGEPVAYGPKPAVTASLVERAGWRLAEVLGPFEGLLPGQDDPDPTTFQGVHVRTVAKTRRDGTSPVQIVVGDRRQQFAVAVASRDVSQVLASEVITLEEPVGVTVAALPAIDLDADGKLEVVVWGELPVPGEGGVRAVLELELVGDPTLRLRSLQTSVQRTCSTQ